MRGVSAGIAPQPPHGPVLHTLLSIQLVSVHGAHTSPHSLLRDASCAHARTCVKVARPRPVLIVYSVMHFSMVSPPPAGTQHSDHE
jgi:hypothetical protein